jgi:hypothetical protein
VAWLPPPATLPSGYIYVRLSPRQSPLRQQTHINHGVQVSSPLKSPPAAATSGIGWCWRHSLPLSSTSRTSAPGTRRQDQPSRGPSTAVAIEGIRSGAAAPGLRPPESPSSASSKDIRTPHHRPQRHRYGLGLVFTTPIQI